MRGVLLVVFLLAAGGTTAASADAPAGFTVEPVISARAAWVAGKPVTVGCAATADDWSSYIASIGGAPADFPNGAADAYGVTPQPGQPLAYLAPDTCAVLHARMNKKRFDVHTLGAALFIVATESLHMRGEIADGQTACDALHLVGAFAIAKWGFHNHTHALGQLLYGARDYHRRQTAPQYHAGSCG